MSDALRARLTGSAARFIGLLRDFGHLDDRAVTEILIAAAEEATGRDEVQIDLATMRRISGRYLFERGSGEIEAGRGILVEDWPLLFS